MDYCVAGREAAGRLWSKDWVPTAPDTSLYIRPFIIATDDHILGVHASETYLFADDPELPSGPYYATGLAPVSIMDRGGRMFAPSAAASALPRAAATMLLPCRAR